MQRGQGSVPKPDTGAGRVKKWLGIGGAAVPILGALVATTFWVDDRYAHAEDFQRSMVQQNLLTQESMLELRLEQNAFQTRSITRRMQAGSDTPALDAEELNDLRVNRESLRNRKADIRMKLQQFQ